MNTKAIVIIVVGVLLLVLLMKNKKKDNFMVPAQGSIAPVTASVIGVEYPRSGFDTSNIRGVPSLSGVDFSGLATNPEDMPLDRSTKDKIVGEYLTTEDLLPDNTMFSIRNNDPYETRQVSVQMRSRFWQDSNPWVVQPQIEPVQSIHKFIDVNPEHDIARNAYSQYDPAMYVSDLRMI